MEEWNENLTDGGPERVMPEPSSPPPVADEWALAPEPAAAEPTPAEPATPTPAWTPPAAAQPLPPAPASPESWPTPAPVVSEFLEPAASVAEPVQAAPVAAAESKPFWKRELSLGRKPKAAAAASTPAAVENAEVRPPQARAAVRPKREARSGGSHKKLVGLTVGAAGLGAAEVANNGHAEVRKLATRPLPRGVVAGGELRDGDMLATELKAFFREHNLPHQNVRLGIASNRIAVRVLEVAGVENGKQLENAVRFRAQEALPIPIDQTVLDHRILAEQTADDGSLSRRVLLVAAYRESVDRYVSACKEAGIRLVGIDLEAFGLLRALGTGGASGAADVVVSLGHERSILAISAHGICEFTRVFEWGGHNLDVAVSRELELEPAAAEPIRRALGVGGTSTPAGLDDERAATARAAVDKQLHAFARELVSSLQFYQDQPGSLGFGQIVLAGGLAQTPGIDGALERLIGVPVIVGNPLGQATPQGRVAEHENLPALAGAIGLGMEV